MHWKRVKSMPWVETPLGCQTTEGNTGKVLNPNTTTPRPKRRKDQSECTRIPGCSTRYQKYPLLIQRGQSQQNTKSLRLLQDRKLEEVWSNHEPWTAPPQSRITLAPEGHLFLAHQAQLSARSNQSKEQHLKQSWEQTPFLFNMYHCSGKSRITGVGLGG